jgi:hypothetical protein
MVEGSPRTTWTQCAIDELPDFLGDDAFNKKLISITDAKKILDKRMIERLAVLSLHSLKSRSFEQIRERKPYVF